MIENVPGDLNLIIQKKISRDEFFFLINSLKSADEERYKDYICILKMHPKNKRHI